MNVALIGVFAALIAVLTFAPPIPAGNAGVPITLQSLGVALAGLVLGPWRAPPQQASMYAWACWDFPSLPDSPEGWARSWAPR